MTTIQIAPGFSVRLGTPYSPYKHDGINAALDLQETWTTEEAIRKAFDSNNLCLSDKAEAAIAAWWSNPNRRAELAVAAMDALADDIETAMNTTALEELDRGAGE